MDSRVWEVSGMVGSLWALEGGCRPEGMVKTLQSSTQGSYKGDTDLLLLYPASLGPLSHRDDCGPRALWPLAILISAIFPATNRK